MCKQNWWSDSTREKFESKMQCFVKQYSDITFPALKQVPGYSGPTSVNGKQTLGENIAGMCHSIDVSP